MVEGNPDKTDAGWKGSGGQRYILVFWAVGSKVLKITDSNNLTFSEETLRKTIAMQATVARVFFQVEVPANSK